MSVIVSDSASYEGANNISFFKRLKLGKITSNISQNYKTTMTPHFSLVIHLVIIVVIIFRF